MQMQRIQKCSVKTLILTVLVLMAVMVNSSVFAQIMRSSDVFQKGFERRKIAQKAYINRKVSINEATYDNMVVGEAVELSGKLCFSDKKQGKIRFFANTRDSVNPNYNMDYVFGIEFPGSVPDDPRINDNSSEIRVKGRIIGFERVFNSKASVFSSHKLPIVEIAEVEFSREPYETPLRIQFF